MSQSAAGTRTGQSTITLRDGSAILVGHSVSEVLQKSGGIGIASESPRIVAFDVVGAGPLALDASQICTVVAAAALLAALLPRGTLLPAAWLFPFGVSHMTQGHNHDVAGGEIRMTRTPTATTTTATRATPQGYADSVASNNLAPRFLASAGAASRGPRGPQNDPASPRPKPSWLSASARSVSVSALVPA